MGSVRYNESLMYINLQNWLSGIKNLGKSKLTNSVNLHLRLMSYSTVLFSFSPEWRPHRRDIKNLGKSKITNFGYFPILQYCFLSSPEWRPHRRDIIFFFRKSKIMNSAYLHLGLISYSTVLFSLSAEWRPPAETRSADGCVFRWSCPDSQRTPPRSSAENSRWDGGGAVLQTLQLDNTTARQPLNER